MSRKILLITGNDDTYRRPLLEAQGYSVEAVHTDHALSAVAQDGFHLALVNTETGIPATIEMCRQMKSLRPQLRVAILAQQSESIPDDCADVVIRVQYSPAKFIGAINTLLNSDHQPSS